MKKVFGSIGKYFKGVKKEIGRVRWTNRKDLLSSSTKTVIFMLGLGIYFYVIDVVISLLRSVAA